VQEELHARLEQELASRPEPPIGTLVSDALRRGRRLRRIRRVTIAAATLTAVGVLAAGTVLGGQLLRTLPVDQATPAAGTEPELSIAPNTTTPTAQPVSGTAGPNAAPAADQPWPGPVIGQPPGPRTRANPAALLYRLVQLLPHGRTSTYRALSTDPPQARLYLNRGKGNSMITIGVWSADTMDGCSSSTGITEKCLVTADGFHVKITEISNNCIESTSVSVDHGNGVVVQLDLSSCLAWNGSANPPAPLALDTGTAIAIAADPSWGPAMSSALVAAADKAYPQLPVS
jgi:hypothetical protein